MFCFGRPPSDNSPVLISLEFAANFLSTIKMHGMPSLLTKTTKKQNIQSIRREIQLICQFRTTFCGSKGCVRQLEDLWTMATTRRRHCCSLARQWRHLGFVLVLSPLPQRTVRALDLISSPSLEEVRRDRMLHTTGLLFCCLNPLQDNATGLRSERATLFISLALRL